MIVALHDSRIAATSISAIYSVVLDALTRRLVELTLARPRRPGDRRSRSSRSAATRAARPSRAPTSTARSSGTAPPTSRRPPAAARDRHARRRRGLGVRPAPRRARRNASDLRFVRSEESWRRVARSWMNDPTQEQALILVSVLRRQPAGVGHPRRPAGRRGVRPRAPAPRAAAPARALRALLPPADGLPARPRRRAHRRAPRAPRPQARRDHPDRRPRALGRRCPPGSPAPRPPSACGRPATRARSRAPTPSRCSTPTS